MNEEKRLSQIQSAKRSLVTNLICMFVFTIGITVDIMMPVEIRTYFCVIFFTLVKGFMPVLSTVANFGTIQSVCWQYKEHFCQLRVVKFICKT
jgi:hypothetical protein